MIEKRNNKIFYIIGVLILILIISNFYINSNKTSGLECNAPYMESNRLPNAVECCLDANSNNICDMNENQETQETNEITVLPPKICDPNSQDVLGENTIKICGSDGKSYSQILICYKGVIFSDSLKSYICL